MTDFNQPNPLKQYYRQPKIYIRLPSNGSFYPPGTLDVSDSGEYPVFAMTAKDELMFKTPDALLSGQSTVEVIKSCFPSIIDPWKMPTLDLDAVLIAIRIATYGETMDVDTTCPSCESENTYAVDLTAWLDKANNVEYHTLIDHDPLRIHIRPYTYQEITKTNLKTFEQQRIFSVINDENLSDEQKISAFNDSFVKLTQLTVEVVAGCIHTIESPQGSTTDPNHIKEFIENAPKELFDVVSEHINKIRNSNELDPISVTCASCSHEYDLPITMDQSNFFAPGS